MVRQIRVTSAEAPLVQIMQAYAEGRLSRAAAAEQLKLLGQMDERGAQQWLNAFDARTIEMLMQRRRAGFRTN
jgi:hypothetical protein